MTDRDGIDASDVDAGTDTEADPGAVEEAENGDGDDVLDFQDLKSVNSGGDHEPKTFPDDDMDGSDHAERVDLYDRVINGVGKLADQAAADAGVLVFGLIGLLLRAGHEFIKAGTTTALTIIPFASRVWKSLAQFAIYRYHKKAGGDAIGLVHMPSGNVDLEAVKYVAEDPEEKKSAGWHAKSREKSWDEGADGREVDYLGGKTPIALFDESASQRATPLEARWAQALDLDRVEDVYLNAQLRQVKVESPGAGANGAAIADGGVTSDVTVDAKGPLADNLVDISPRDNHDGMRISTRKVKNTYRQEAGSEKIEEAKRLGFLAGRMGNMDRTDMVKIMLIALGIVAAATMGPGLIEGLFSSASSATSGGGGGIVPF
ncbi:hypothetical protein DVK02_14965 [Halobellus sp. Atlit-31R]|nr:hypothetical protein DVK02_14965 [Halobellus sp. Atlit-31R]